MASRCSPSCSSFNPENVGHKESGQVSHGKLETSGSGRVLVVESQSPMSILPEAVCLNQTEQFTY